MPQLEFATYASQIFWLTISFGLLYVIMARSGLPTVREVLQNRQTRISEDLKKAEKLKEEAESAEADFTSVIADARARALSLLTDVRDRAAKEADRRNANLDETFARQAKEADHRIEVIKKEAISEMTPITIDVADDMLRKLVGKKIDRKKIEAVVSQYSA